MELIPDPLADNSSTRNIERDTKILIAFNGMANIALGLSILLFTSTAAEGVLDRYLPRNLWPIMWLMTGIMGIVGINSRFMARTSFVLCGVVYLVFAMAGLWAVVVEGKYAAIVTVIFLIYVWGLLWGISALIRQRSAIVFTVASATERAAETLDKIEQSNGNGNGDKEGEHDA